METFKMPLNKIEPIMKEVLDSGGEFRMVIKGTSMLPLLRQGKDSVILKKVNPNKHDVILYQRKEGSFVLHRIVGKRDKGFILCGDNQFVKEYPICNKDIIAVMTAFVRDGKRINTRSFKYRLYVQTLVFRRLYKRAKFIIRGVVRQ